MTIHIVQPGDTIYSIAETYNIPYLRLLQDNNLPPNPVLNIGQALMIVYPEQTYSVQNGDTLESIANTYGVTILQLLRNNPQLSGRDNLLIGEQLVISYNNKDKKIKVNGFASYFIAADTLIKTLPFLTYITVLNYRVTEDGSLLGIDDDMILQMSREYGVAPLMFISTLNDLGVGDYAITHNVLSNLEIQNTLIDNILAILKSKGYYGLYLGFQQILPDDLQLYVDFVTNVSNRMNREGYEVFVSLIPSIFGFKQDVPYKETYFSDIGKAANYVTLITYQWPIAFIPQFIEASVGFLKQYLDYVVTQIPPEKIFLGLSRIAYDWELPYLEGVTPGSFLTNATARALASDNVVIINFDEATKSPYFYYRSLAGIDHFVWYKDTRTHDAILNLVSDYGLYGVAVWNIMYYYPHTWLTINSQYNIESVLNNTYNEPST